MIQVVYIKLGRLFSSYVHDCSGRGVYGVGRFLKWDHCNFCYLSDMFVAYQTRLLPIRHVCCLSDNRNVYVLAACSIGRLYDSGISPVTFLRSMIARRII